MVISNRDTTLDVVKGLGILFVIWGHCCYSNRVVYLFHMPLFFFATGCLVSIKRLTYKNVISSIGWPYLFWGTIFFFYWLIVETRIRTEVPEYPIFCDVDIITYKVQLFLNIFCGICKTGAYAQNEVIWFLPALLSCELVIIFLTKKISLSLGWIVVLLLSIISVFLRRFHFDLPFALDRAFLAAPFMYLGYFFYSKYSIVKKSYVKNILLFAISFLSFCLIAYYKDDMVFDIFSFYIYSLEWFYFVPILGIIAVLSLSNFMSGFKTLIWLGQNSILLMLFHVPVLKIMINISSFLFGLSKPVIREYMLSYWGGTLMSIAVLIFCIPLTYVTAKYLPWTYKIKELIKK